MPTFVSRRAFIRASGAFTFVCGLGHTHAFGDEEAEIQFCTELLSLDPEAEEHAVNEWKDNKVPSGTPYEAAASQRKRWNPKRKSLSVDFISQPSYVDKVISAAKKWEQYTNVEFKFGQGNPEILVDFVKGGSWSLLGTDSSYRASKGERSMNFGWFNDSTSTSEFNRTTLHEFGHALSLVHEHKRPQVDIPWDKKKVYQYYLELGSEYDEEWVNHNVFDKYSEESTYGGTDYDPKSIMHYPIPKKLLLDPAFAVGWNSELSEKDKTFVQTLFS